MAAGDNNSPANLNIDEIVREVFARLAATANPASAKPGREKQKSASSELVLSTKVVSVAELEARLNGAASVVVPKGAVITPSARDLLKRRGVNVSYAVAHAAGFEHRLLVGAAETGYEAAGLVRALTAESVAIERLANTGLIGVVDEMCDGVAKGGQLGLLLTSQTEAASCLANRRAGVRAAVGADKRQIGRAIVELGVNFLAVSPERHGMFELKQMVKEFLTAGPRVCPENLKQRLR